MYGIIISASILISSLLAERQVKKEKLSTEIFWGLILWSLIFGIIGARLYHVINYYKFYSRNLLQIFQIWKGGLGILGGIIGALIGGLVYLKVKKERVFLWTDVLALYASLAQATGRWGNFFNQELYGKPTAFFWGIYIEPAKRLKEVAMYNKFHPLFLYESFLDLLLFFILLKVKKASYVKPKLRTDGLISLSYAAGYGIIRFVLEFFRINPWTIYGINVAQTISLILIFISGILTFKLLNKQSKIKT